VRRNCGPPAKPLREGLWGRFRRFRPVSCHFGKISIGVRRGQTTSRPPPRCRVRVGQSGPAPAEHRIAHRYCRPYRPQTNGKVERFNRTLLEEWAYIRIYVRDCDRTRALARWPHMYNHLRPHSSLGGQPPISRVTNVPGQYT